MDRDPVDLTPAVHTRAPERSQPNAHGWTRADLVELIAHSLNCSLTFLERNNCRAAADSLLRCLGGAGLKISSTEPIERRQPRDPRPTDG